MKKHSKMIILSSAIIFSILSAFIAYNPAKNEKTSPVLPANATEAEIEMDVVSAPEHEYVAKIWDNSLVIFATSDMNEPYYISNISLYSLTNEDYKKLKDGIYLDTQEDISRLLEDFES